MLLHPLSDYHATSGIVTLCEGPCNIWYVPTSHICILNTISYEMRNFKHSPYRLQNAHIGDVVAAPYKSKYYRGKISSFIGTSVFIYFSDLGNKERVNFSKLTRCYAWRRGHL